MKFGQYELLEPIAIGGMAEVFKGRVVAAEGFEKYVAIKRILPDLVADERFVKMLLTEARIHSALSHRNIVQIHDLGISENGEYFIVLEYVEGYDLRIITDQLAAENEIIPEALSLYIAAEVAEGLHFAHEMRGPDGQPLGLVHRDVTPSNVLISFAGEVKLSDFGLAKRRHDNSVVGSLKGNLAYMSPEQAKQAPLDRRTDIFSLGALLFELLTGRRLREITDEIAGWSQVASGVIPSARRLRPDLPLAIERLLDGALAPDPGHRFPDAAAFGAALRDALSKLNMPVGASDLAALLGIIKPPKRARALMFEPSKVIRLGSEAQALREAIAAPVTPAPVVSPGMTPAQSRAADLLRFRDPAATPAVEIFPPPESRDPMATPAPSVPLPPARTRGYTPHQPSERPRPRAPTPAPNTRPAAERPRPRAPTPAPNVRPAVERPRPRAPTPAGYDRAPAERERAQAPPPAGGRPVGERPRTLGPTPAGGRPVGGERPRTLGPTPAGGRPVGGERPRTLGPTPAGGRPVGERPRTLGPTPAGGRPVGGERPRTLGPTPFTGARPIGNQVQARSTGPNPVVGSRGPLFRTPSYGVKRPSGQSFVIGPTGPVPVGPGPARTTAPRLPAAGFDFPREQRDTARVQLRSPRRWRGRIFGLLVLLGAAAAAVNFYVAPLEVLAAWSTPARLSIATDPNGATLALDGARLAQPTPVTVSVRRDRTEHVIDASYPGYRPAREVIRFDRSVGLAFLLRLEKDPSAPPPQATRDGGTAGADAAPSGPAPASP